MSREVDGSRRCGGVIRIRLPAEPRKAAMGCCFVLTVGTYLPMFLGQVRVALCNAARN